MGTLEIVGGVILLLVCVVIMIAVVLQDSKGGGLGAIGGGDSSNGSYFDKNRGKTKEAMLIRATSISGTVLVVVVLAVLFVNR